MARTDYHNDNGRRRRTRKVYGGAKRLEMARSVLPSTARKGARDSLAHIRRTSRREVARDLRRYTGAPGDAVDRYNDDGIDLARYPDDEIKEAMWERRSADKLAPFQRWAVEKTRNLPLEERLETMRKVMPRNLIGRHALSHLRWMDEFRSDEHKPWWWIAPRRPREGPSEPNVLGAAVRGVVAAGRHGELNRWMKRHAGPWTGHPGPDRARWHLDERRGYYRVLVDIHDAQAFVDDIWSAEYDCPDQYRALVAFVERV